MKKYQIFLVAGFCVCARAVLAQPITYQGSLTSSGNAANQSFDFIFALFNAYTNGTQVGVSVTNLDIPVSNGVFTTTMDFGSTAYSAGSRWLRISLRTNGSASGFTNLAPRQAITASPLAVFALSGNPGPAGTNGAPGTTGQSATTVFGTGSVTPALSTEALMPGLTQTVTVPTNCVVYLSADGTARTTSSSSNGFSTANFYFKIDGTVPSNGGFGVLDLVNGAKTGVGGHWTLSLATAVTPGSHTFSVYGFNQGSSPASFSGGTGSIDQGEFTVLILKQ